MRPLRRMMRHMFLVVEINLLLWMAVLGASVIDSDDRIPWAGWAPVPRGLVFAGVAFAAIVQHWAYYALYRQSKVEEPSAAPPR